MKKMLAMLLCLTMTAVLLTVSVYAEDEPDEVITDPGYVDDTDDSADIYDDISSDYDGSDFTEGLPEDNYSTEEEQTNTNAIKVPDGITVVLDGKTVVFDAAQPKLVNGRTLVPMRKMFESLGAEVVWDEDTNTAKAVKGTMSVEISIGSYTMYSSGKAVDLDVPAQLIYDKTYVPVRFISEALGTEVDWDDEKQTVYINTID